MARLHRTLGGEVQQTVGGAVGLQIVRVPEGETVPQLVAKYQRSGLVAFAEPDYLVHLASTTPNDPKFIDGTLWGLNKIEAPAGDGVRRMGWFPPDGGVLFARDTQFVIQGDSLVRADPFVHPLMVLGFDVYALPVEQTLGKLRQLGFDLATTHEDTWQGRPVVVVGAKAGDLHTRQFWVDKERLVFVRMLEPARRDSTATTETQFNDYRPFGKAWVSAQVLFLTGGQRRWMEEYDEIAVNVALADGVFDVKRWRDTK